MPKGRGFRAAVLVNLNFDRLAEHDDGRRDRSRPRPDGGCDIRHARSGRLMPASTMTSVQTGYGRTEPMAQLELTPAPTAWNPAI
jgi:hypothetical protein